MSLAQLNASSRDEFLTLLSGTYEHSPWVVEQAWLARPFRSIAHLKRALVEAVRAGGHERQLALIRAHPELAGKAMVANTLTAESTNEQGKAGLTACTVEEFAQIQSLNQRYNDRFGWPFILAVRGPRGLGLDREAIIRTFARRLDNPADFEFAECLRNIHRIAEIRLDERLGLTPSEGNRVWDWAQALAAHSDPGFAERGELTVTYLTEAHRACAAQLVSWMRDECGFDSVAIDAVGNVVGLYQGSQSADSSKRSGSAQPPRRLLTGSHYDTVRNGGKYDGRLGILVPMACVRALHRQGLRLPFDLEVVGFAEEEGQRYRATFLGSGALTGQFDDAWLDQCDAQGIPMRQAMQNAGLDPTQIGQLRREPADYLGFVEVHIEQGPVLNALDLPLGVVTSINGSVRFAGKILGMASHAGTTPMHGRRDAATAAAELALYLENRAASVPDLVGTMGMLEVPGGSINVVPGRCEFSLDIRATRDAVRNACVDDVRLQLAQICQRRGLRYELEEILRIAAAPSHPQWQLRWEKAVSALGLPVRQMPSGAGHDAMKLHEIMPQAMLFVRGENAGISHNPLESVTQHDAQLCIDAFTALLQGIAADCDAGAA